MEHAFWQERWAAGQLGFHQLQPDRILVEHWQAMSVDAGSKVFVPLCGKSLDMLWLRVQGHSVVGVELSTTAVADFFRENNLDQERDLVGEHSVHRCDGIELWCGDFFTLPTEAVSAVDAVYDRGSLVALPPEMRVRYAKRLQGLLPRTPIFLSCVEYDQSEMNGPPFSISRDEIDQHYGVQYDIELIHEEPDREIPERFRQRGLTAISSKGYIMRSSVSAS